MVPCRLLLINYFEFSYVYFSNYSGNSLYLVLMVKPIKGMAVQLRSIDTLVINNPQAALLSNICQIHASFQIAEPADYSYSTGAWYI